MERRKQGGRQEFGGGEDRDAETEDRHVWRGVGADREGTARAREAEGVMSGASSGLWPHFLKLPWRICWCLGAGPSQRMVGKWGREQSRREDFLEVATDTGGAS